MHPILFQIGPLAIPSYGIMAVITLMIGMIVVRRYARLEGRDPTQTMEAIFWSLMAGFVAAHVLEAIINWPRYFGVPGGLKLLLVSAGVMVGGVIGAIAFGIYWFHRIKLPLLQGLDILAPMGAIAEAVGRWGCFASGCCWGTPTDLPWAVTFPDLARRLHKGLPDVPLHPTQIYMSLVGFAVLTVLVLLYRRKRFHGQIMCAFLFLFSVTRFFIEFVRGDAERGTVFGGALSTSQFIGSILAVLAVVGYIWLARRHRLTGERDWAPSTAISPMTVAPKKQTRRRKSS